MTMTNEYYFEKYLDSYGNDREEKGRAEGRAEEAKKAKVKLRNILKKKGFSPREIEESLLEYSAG